jgi:hypothetical protein
VTVADIVREFLVLHGFDGLAGEYCGCEVSDLMPCAGPYGNGDQSICQPGYKTTCPDDGECDGKCKWHMATSVAVVTGGDE